MISIEKFGTLNDKRKVNKYILENDFLKIEILNYGGIITEIIQKKSKTTNGNIVLGFDNIKDYIEKSPHFGCITGRIAGRIAKGILKINDKEYKLPINNGENSLHGGIKGLDKKIWNTKEIKNKCGIELTYDSEHLEEGYPGNVNFKVSYILKDEELLITYEGTSDRKTFLNLTNHTYFNLTSGEKNVLSHRLYIDADNYGRLNENSIPIEVVDVGNSIFDRRKNEEIREIKTSENEDIKIVGQGFDHPFILNKKEKYEIKLSEERSDIEVELETSESCVVVYTGNFLGEEGKLSNGKLSKKYMGICLETQEYPDAPNQNVTKVRYTDENNPYKAWTKYKITAR